jgi:hypothetical protein
VTDPNPVSCPNGVSRNASSFVELQMLVHYVEKTMALKTAGMSFKYLRRDNYGSGFSTSTEIVGSKFVWELAR